MTPKDQKSRELVLRRRQAHDCAFWLEKSFDSLDRASGFKENSALQDNALEHAHNIGSTAMTYLWLFCGTHRKNLSKALRAVADALDKKLNGRNARLDAVLLKAYADEARAIRRGMKTLDVGLFPKARRVYDRVRTGCKRIDISPAPTEFAMKRRLTILGCPCESSKRLPQPR